MNSNESLILNFLNQDYFSDNLFSPIKMNSTSKETGLKGGALCLNFKHTHQKEPQMCTWLLLQSVK